jgi:hypothetical protein
MNGLLQGRSFIVSTVVLSKKRIPVKLIMQMVSFFCSYRRLYQYFFLQPFHHLADRFTQFPDIHL